MKKISKSLKQYLETAIWSSLLDENDYLNYTLKPLSYSIKDFSNEALVRAEKDWSEFQKQAGSLLSGLDLTDVAHDFWLTRNKYGSSFLDGEYPKDISKSLNNLSHRFDEMTLYIGDDEKLHFE